TCREPAPSRSLWRGVAGALANPAVKRAVFAELAPDLVYRYGAAAAAVSDPGGAILDPRSTAKWMASRSRRNRTLARRSSPCTLLPRGLEPDRPRHGPLSAAFAGIASRKLASAIRKGEAVRVRPNS